MNDLVRLVLRDFFARQGASAVASGAAVRESLSAALPDSTREIDALAIAADAQIPQELRDYSTPAEARIALQASAWRLENGLSLERPVAVWTVLTLSSALGHLGDEQFQSLLTELGGEASVAIGPAPAIPPVEPQPEPPREFEAQDGGSPTTTSPPVYPPPPPRPQRHLPPPPRPERAQVKRQPQRPPRKFRPISIVLGIAFALLISRFASRVNTPVKPAAAPPTSAQTEPPVDPVPAALPPDEPDPPGALKRPPPLQIPDNLQSEKLLTQVQPAYPALAKQAKIEGSVVLQILLAPDGTVRKVMPLSGHPLLLPAAIAAVKQWRYMPTMVDGFPVEVETRVQLQFHIKR